MASKSWAFLLLLATVSSACVASRAPDAPAGAVSSQPTTAVAPRPPTGKYGEVQGIQLVTGGIQAFELQGKAAKAEKTLVPVDGQEFAQALRVEVKEASQNPWDVQLGLRLTQSVQAGDVILATVYLKTEATRDESGEGRSEFVMELSREPWSKSVEYPLRAGHDWKKINVRFRAARTYAPGEAQLLFRLGYPPQTLLLGGLSVENFGSKLALEDLPTTRLTYPGMEADAPWRAAAAERIEKLRKRELAITVRDAAGKPLPGADVTIHQTKQAFGFGSAVVAQFLTRPGHEQYNQLVAELFNTAVFENNLKWQPLAGDWGEGWTVDVALKGVDWLAQHGIQTRGHVLVWPGFRNLPRSVKALEKDPAKLRAAVLAHVTELATATRGKLVHWDVLNEPFDNHDLMDLLGEDVMVDWFKAARAADPAAQLFINDYAILSGGGGTTPHRDNYERVIKLLIDKGAPVDGVGLQGHFGSSLTGPEDILKLLDRYAKLGKQIWITEYDIDIDDEALAGQFTRDFFTTLFSHPAVGGIVMWGFWDGAHWRHNAPLYRQDFSLKPAGQVYRDLVLREFRTDATGKTDATGAFSTRAFFGKYAISVNAAGKKKTVELDLNAKTSAVSIKLD